MCQVTLEFSHGMSTYKRNRNDTSKWVMFHFCDRTIVNENLNMWLSRSFSWKPRHGWCFKKSTHSMHMNAIQANIKASRTQCFTKWLERGWCTFFKIIDAICRDLFLGSRCFRNMPGFPEWNTNDILKCGLLDTPIHTLYPVLSRS